MAVDDVDNLDTWELVHYGRDVRGVASKTLLYGFFNRRWYPTRDS